MATALRANKRIIVGELRYHEVAAKWIPRLLTDERKCLRLALSLHHLMHYQQHNVLPHQIVDFDESWCYHYQPGSKPQSMQ